MSQAVAGFKTRKFIFQVASGAVVGGVASYLFFEFGDGFADLRDPNRLAASAIGIVYALMGLFVGLGSLVPGAGAKLLNVEDAEEIVEERSKFLPGALACLLAGILLIALSLTPGGEFAGAFSRDVAAAIAAISFAGLLAVSFWMRGRTDEFSRALGTEASALAMHVCTLLIGGWAALAHLGYVGWIAPLGLLAAFSIAQLGAIFWVIGKRGMLAPR